LPIGRYYNEITNFKKGNTAPSKAKIEYTMEAKIDYFNKINKQFEDAS